MKIKRLRNRDAERQQKIAQETLILDVTEAVFEQLEVQGKTKADLAKRMGRSNAYITQLLNGARNMTLRTLADIAFALDIEPRFEIGYQDQLCQEPNWVTFVTADIKTRPRVRCHELTADENTLSGIWVDACVDDVRRPRAA